MAGYWLSSGVEVNKLIEKECGQNRIDYLTFEEIFLAGYGR